MALPIAGRRLSGSAAGVIRTAAGPKFHWHPNAGNSTRRLPHGGWSRQGAVVYCRLGPLSEDRIDRKCLLPFDSTSVLSSPQEFTNGVRKSGYSRFQKPT